MSARFLYIIGIVSVCAAAHYMGKETERIYKELEEKEKRHKEALKKYEEKMMNEAIDSIKRVSIIIVNKYGKRRDKVLIYFTGNEPRSLEQLTKQYKSKVRSAHSVLHKKMDFKKKFESYVKSLVETTTSSDVQHRCFVCI